MMELAKIIAIGIVVGGLIGWGTNVLVFQMLFGEIIIWKWRILKFNGLLQKKQPALANKIGSVVAEELMTPEILQQEFDNNNMRSSIKNMISKIVEEYANKDLGTLCEVAGEKFIPQLQETRTKILKEFVPVVEKNLFSDESVKWIAEEIVKMLKYYGETPLIYVIGTEKIDLLLKKILKLLSDSINNKENTIFNEISEFVLEQLKENSDTIDEKLKHFILQASDQYTKAVVDDAIDYFVAWLFEPHNNQRIKEGVRPILDAVTDKLQDEYKLLALFVDIEDRVTDAVDNNWEDIISFISEKLKNSENREKIEQLVSQYIPILTNKISFKTFIQSSSFTLLYADISIHLKTQIKQLADSTQIFNLLQVESYKFLQQSIADLIPDWKEKASLFIINSLKEYENVIAHQRISPLYKIADEMSADFIQNVKIGKLSMRISNKNRMLIVDESTTLIHKQLIKSIPEIFSAVPVQSIVEKQVKDFSPEDMAQTIRTVANNEMHTIVQLGGYLGAFAGGVAQLIIYIL